MEGSSAPAEDPLWAEGAVSFSFTYADTLRPGTTIRESLWVDKSEGCFTWERMAIALSGGTPSFAPSGGQWSAADVAGIQFVTKHGDPGLEHMSVRERWLAMRRGMARWFHEARRAAVVLVNPLTLFACLVLAMTSCLWDVFPRADGAYAAYPRSGYNMAAPADEPALDWATALAFLALAGAAGVGWWLRSLSAKWRVQKPCVAVLVVILSIWCLVVGILCPVAKATNTAKTCAPTTIDDGGLGAGRLLSSGMDGECYAEPDGTKMCGIGGCSCSAISDVSCYSPPDPPGVVCQMTIRPLCKVPGSPVETSGWHRGLLTLASLSTVFTIVLFLGWLANTGAMLLQWLPGQGSKGGGEPPDSGPKVPYHQFAVSFREPSEPGLIFTMSYSTNPSLVALLLLGGTPASEPRRPAESD